MRRIAGIAAKVVAGMAAFVVVAVIAAIVFLRTERGHDVLRRRVLAEARKSLPGLSVGALRGGLLGDLSLEDVEIRDARGQTAVHVDQVTVRYHLLQLLHHEIAVDDVAVRGLAIVGSPDPAGGLNLAHLTIPSVGTKSPPDHRAETSPWRIHVTHALVDGASAKIDTADGATLRVSSLRAEGSVALDERSIDARLAALRIVGLLPEGRPVSVTARATGPREAMATQLELDTSGAGRVTVDGTLGLTQSSDGATTLGPYALSLDLVDVDPSALREDAPRGRVSLSLRANGKGLPLSPDARAHAELTFLRSELAGVQLLGGHARGDASGDAWELAPSDLRIEGAALTLSGHGRGRHLLADADLSVEGAAVNAALQGRARTPPLRGHATLALHAEGTVGEAFAVRGKATAKDLRVQDVRVGSLALELHADGTLEAPNGTVSLIATHVVAAREAPVVDRANVKLVADRGQLRIQASARGPRLRAAVSARGTANAKEGDVTVDQLALDMTTPAYRQQLALVAPARVQYRTGEEVKLGRTVIKGAGARFTGQATVEGEVRPHAAGRTPLAHVRLQLANASTGGLTPLNAALEATVTRARGIVHLDASMPAAAAQVKLDAEVPLELPRRGPPRLASHGQTKLRLTTNRIQLQQVPIAQRALARQGVTGGTVSLDVQASGDIAHPVASCAFDLRNVTYRNLAGMGRDSRLKTVPGLGGSLKVDAKDGSIAADAQLFIRNTGVLVGHIVVPIDLGALLVGARPQQLPLRATVTIPKLRLSSLADFADGFAGIDGQLHGTVEIAGTLDRPSGQANLTIDGAQVDKLRFKQVHLLAEARQGLAQGRLVVEELTGGRLDGSVKLERDHGNRLEAYLTGKDLDVSFARLFLPNVREVAGVAQLSATAKGTLSAPQVWATLSLEKGRIGVTGQPTFRDVRFAVAMKPGRLDLNNLEMSSGDGRLQGHGGVTLGGPRALTPQAAVFEAHAHRFLVAVAGSGGARIDGDLAFEAAMRADVLAGRVNVPNANIWLPKTPSAGKGGKLQKVGQHGDVRFVDATALAAAERDLQKKRQAAAAAFRVAFKATASPTYVRGKDLDIEVRSNVEIGTVPDGPHRGAVTLGGAIHIPRGRINIQGQRFDFDHGNVTFDGSWDVNPALDIKLTKQFPDAMVVIELRGTPRKPQLRLSSDPAIYDQSQIVSLVLTGQPGGAPSNGKSFDPTSAVATAVLSRLADQVAPELGLDVMRVEKQDVKNEEGQATGDTDTRVEVGKYITERIYLSYAHIFGAPDNANQNEAHAEYRMTRRWMLETIFGDAGQGGLDALWTYRF